MHVRRVNYECRTIAGHGSWSVKARKRFAGYWLNKLLSAFELEFRQLTKTPL
jgi:hypothetical protein